MFTSPIWGLACLLAGWLTAYLLRYVPHSNCFHSGRLKSLDGLRGVLALVVFICHASTWQQYLVDQRWRVSDTPLYVLPAQTSVLIFFMLTGFLFTRKFLMSGKASENWIRLYTSRILRLGPAYMLMLAALAVVVALQILYGQARWSECYWRDGLAWLAFTLPGAPPLCGYAQTNVAVSGVTWSLTYEWVFYFSLPLLAVITGKRVPVVVLLVGGAVLVVSLRAAPWYSVVYLSFVLGIGSAFIDFRRPSIWLQNSAWAGIAAVTLLVVNGFVHTQTSYTIPSVLVVGLAFHVFASGNTLMGVLSTRTFQVFGLCTYSLYLFHGLLLYTVLSVLTRFFPLLHTDAPAYWSTIILLTPMLIAGTLLIYLRLEYRSLQRTHAISVFIESLLCRWIDAVKDRTRSRM